MLCGMHRQSITNRGSKLFSVTIISSQADADCSTAYLDWISVLKSKRHGKIAQKMLMALQDVLKEKGIHLLIALMAGNDEAQRFYRNIENAAIHDEGVWMIF